MSKRALAVLTLVVAVVFLMSSTGCVSKKRFRTLEQENTQQLAQANARIDELVQKNEALTGSLTDAQSALAAAQNENKQLAAGVASLKDQIAGLEGQKAELDKALAAGMETEASYKKKVSNLNYSIGTLKKKAAEMEAAIAAKDTEIASLMTTEASLKAAADEQAQKMAALTADKDTVSAQLAKTVSDKKRTTLILGVLLGLAVILAIIGFARRRKGVAA
jgi:chromosome segregation ATPase